MGCIKPVLHSEVTLTTSAQEEKLSSLMAWGEAEVEGHLIATISYDHEELFATHFCIVKVSVQARRILKLLIILQLHMRSFKRFYHNLAVSPGRILWKRDRSPDEKFLQVQDTVSLIMNRHWRFLKTPCVCV